MKKSIFFSITLVFIIQSLSSLQTTEAENEFWNESQGRLQTLENQDQSMIEKDRNLIKEGYDPNEGLQRANPKDLPTFQDQEQIMRGEKK
jgi:hypothetical protein